MKIDDSMRKLPRIKSFEIIKQFKSRQNQVCLLRARYEKGRGYYVCKQHNQGRAAKEKNILDELYGKGVKVPKVLYSDKSAIIMEYLSGDTLIERIELLEKKNLSAKKEIAALVLFFKEFYQALKDKIHWDINFSNFIFHENSLWGVDFEDVTEGEKETDFGRLFAFLITYSPAFTEWKLNFLREFYTEAAKLIDIDKQKIKQAMKDEFSRMQIRRNMKISEIDMQKIVF